MADKNQYSIYFVATPIGNLSDISYRAIEVLQSVDFVASEDTRKTGQLLKHYNISKKQISFFEHNEQKAILKILDLVAQGNKVAVVSTAGTPGISDPGYKLVQSLIENKITFTMIPGASALLMALVLSGLSVHSFTFRGFPPRKQGARLKFLLADISSPYTLIYYESSHRLKKFMLDAIEVFGDRNAVIANDLTKFYESVMRGRLVTLYDNICHEELLGEYVIVIEGNLKENVNINKRDIQNGQLP
jgi:16S rRNA (cytidine1402-2'-O)-methyltransferase